MKLLNKQQCKENAIECAFKQIEILARLDNVQWTFIVNLWYSFQGKKQVLAIKYKNKRWCKEHTKLLFLEQ